MRCWTGVLAAVGKGPSCNACCVVLSVLCAGQADAAGAEVQSACDAQC
jgi:hypothetical protein